ncbi:MAG: sulfurtransferase [Chloroflexi bacterium]|nr:sulfurtransferase [Chloroflexota bacterium]
MSEATSGAGQQPASPAPDSSPSLNREPFLVSTDWLADHLGDPNVRIVDCRFYFDGRIGRDEYAKGHIPGAIYLDWNTELATKDHPIAFKVARGPQVKRVMEAHGIGDDTLVVAYDEEGGHHAARLWLVLRAHGHTNIRILEGGITRWEQEGRPLTTAPAAPRTATFTPREGPPDFLVTAEQVLAAGQDPNVVVVDVRRESEYTGEEVRAARGGRVPGAVWVFWQDMLDWNGDRSFRPAQELAAELDAAGVTPDKRVITYCQGAVRAAHTALVLEMLGYSNVQVYDGSWEEWGGRSDLPIAAGSQ